MSRETVLLTGASAGIGKALCYEFAKHQYDLVLVARRANLLEELASQLRQQYQINVTVIPQDLSKPAAATQLFNELKQKNLNIDILVNNAGFGDIARFDQAHLPKILDMIAVNITSLTELTYLIIPEMRARNTGKIMNVSSTAAFQAGPCMAVYFASKSYVLMFSEALAEELRPLGISVTALCPGPTTTEFFECAKNVNNTNQKKRKISMTAEAVATEAFKGLLNKKRIIITGGFVTKLLIFLNRFAPRIVATKITAQIITHF